MNKIEKKSYFDLIDFFEKIKNPFSRENHIGVIKPNLGLGNFVWYDSGSGIAILTNNYKLYNDTIITQTSEVSGAILLFNLGNDFTYTFQDGHEYLFKKDTYFLGFSSNKFSVDIDILKNTHYHVLSVGIKEELFLNLAHSLKNLNVKMSEAKVKGYAILKGEHIDPEQEETLQYFKNKNLDEYLLTDLYLESKTTNLIQYTIQKVVNNINTNLNIDKNIIKSLKRAKEIILEQYASSLTIKEIAYKSAINECYLKKEFKIYYNMTVFEMLQDRRMNIAKELLQNNISVKEVSLKVGYKHTGHFGKVFFSYFGKTPSVYRKKFF